MTPRHSNHLPTDALAADNKKSINKTRTGPAAIITFLVNQSGATCEAWPMSSLKQGSPPKRGSTNWVSQGLKVDTGRSELKGPPGRADRRHKEIHLYLISTPARVMEDRGHTFHLPLSPVHLLPLSPHDARPTCPVWAMGTDSGPSDSPPALPPPKRQPEHAKNTSHPRARAPSIRK